MPSHWTAREASTASSPRYTSAVHEFYCPITQDIMVDPVVASDGFSYEREAINQVLSQPEPLSPMTREPLLSNVFPNRNLKNRIAEYEDDVHAAADEALREQSVRDSSSSVNMAKVVGELRSDTNEKQWLCVQEQYALYELSVCQMEMAAERTEHLDRQQVTRARAPRTPAPPR